MADNVNVNANATASELKIHPISAGDKGDDLGWTYLVSDALPSLSQIRRGLHNIRLSSFALLWLSLRMLSLVLYSTLLG